MSCGSMPAWETDLSPQWLDAEAMQSWTVGAQLELRATECGDRPFLAFDDGHKATYAETLHRSSLLAGGLRQLGIGKGDRLALLLDNGPEIVYAWFAANLLGAIEVPINTANRGMTLAHPFNNCAATVAIVDAGLLSQLADIADQLVALDTVVVVGPVPANSFEFPLRIVHFDELNAGSPIPGGAVVAFHDPGAIMYTSGTSGPAKGVLLSHAHMFMLGRHVVDHLSVTAEDTYMICLPLFHANAQFMQLYVALQTGARVMIYRRFSATQWVHQIRACGATVSSLLGVMAQFLYAQPPTEFDGGTALSRLLCLPMPGSIANEFERRFAVRCIEAYGSTEAGLPVFRPVNEALRPGSCGRMLSEWYDVMLADPDTDLPVADGEIGEILVRPKVPYTTFLEYYGMPEETARAWRNLWYHTGDSARQDEAGYFYFVDRTSDRIRRRGENIASHDIEAVLNSHPDVAEAAAVGVPAAEGEDEVKVFVVTLTDSDIEPNSLIDHCQRHLPYFALPRYIERVTELPKTPSGKLQKKELRARGLTGNEWDRGPQIPNRSVRQSI